MIQFIYVWYSIERFYNTNLPFIYIGSHKGNLDDSYISSSKFLSLEMASDDMKWKRLIIKKYDIGVDRTFINEEESKMIKNAFHRYGKSRCVNRTYNNFGNKQFNPKDSCRLINIKNGKIGFYPKHLKKYMLKNGYSLTNGTVINKRCITNGKENKFIDDNIDVLPENWNFGMTMKRPEGHSSIPKGNICIHNDNIHKFININDVTKYIELGWNKGFSDSLKLNLLLNSQKSKRRVFKDGIYKFIDSSLVDIYLENGWVSSPGTIPKGSICINNGIKNKYIKESEISNYINIGWVIGEKKTKKDSIPKGSVCINNGHINKYISKEELNSFINKGWSKGLINRNSNKGSKWMNNGIYDEFVKSSYIESKLSNGWILGKLKNKINGNKNQN